MFLRSVVRRASKWKALPNLTRASHVSSYKKEKLFSNNYGRVNPSSIQNKGSPRSLSTSSSKMAVFESQSFDPEAESEIFSKTNEKWTPIVHHECSFPPEIFSLVMRNFMKNPNLNSTHLYRGEISLDKEYTEDFDTETSEIEIPPRITLLQNFTLNQVVVRTLIPRNIQLDRAIDQTCLIYSGTLATGKIQSLVIYNPHINSASESPFYHPGVRGIGFLHKWNAETNSGSISIYYTFFPDSASTTCTEEELEAERARQGQKNNTPEKLKTTAHHLLRILHKHGQGTSAGYIKRVHHDQILPQATVQNIYAGLKGKYAKDLIKNWVEVTDPTKHVFEDLCIAAFLIALWNDTYTSKNLPIPNFVDIGCGNGLLTHILLSEGYTGTGFDARARKSWAVYPETTQAQLSELVLIPSILSSSDSQIPPGPKIHNGLFPPNTFIISNHADELTPWTPLLALPNRNPFIVIPCCSHNLTGAKFRAPGGSGGVSAYAALVGWTTRIAERCGWVVEKEMLRIPSTRNTALIGRRMRDEEEEVGVKQVLSEFGGAEGWVENAMKLVKSLAPRGH